MLSQFKLFVVFGRPGGLSGVPSVVGAKKSHVRTLRGRRILIVLLEGALANRTAAFRVSAQAQSRAALPLASFSALRQAAPNTSIERTSNSWPRYSTTSLLLPRGQLSAAAHVER